MDGRIAGVLFDIGGVLVALDGGPAMAALLGIEAQHDRIHALWLDSPSVVAHESGRIGAAEFAAGIVAEMRLPVTADVFLQDFRSWPKGLLPGALELLDEIPRSYRVAALSNMSAAHWSSIMPTGLVSRFEQLYLSHEIGHVKPSREAFLAALAGMDLPPSAVLFLDDGRRNVDAARALGIQAEQVKGPAEARTVLAHYGVVPSVRP